MELWGKGESSSDCHFCNLPDTTIVLPPLLEEEFVPVLPALFPLPPATDRCCGHEHGTSLPGERWTDV